MSRGRISTFNFSIAMAVALATSTVYGQHHVSPPRFFRPSGPRLIPQHEKLAQIYRGQAQAAAATPIAREFDSATVGQAQHIEQIPLGASTAVMPDETVYHDNSVMPDGAVGGCGCCPSDTLACSECSACGCHQAIREHLSLFIGVQGFKGPANRGEGGSFGFHEGANWGTPLPYFDRYGWSGQLGFRATQNDLSGAEFSTSNRHQYFLTAGAFRRADWGLQGGLVVDWMNDNWYYKADLAQLRGELSFALNPVNSVGFWFATNTGTDTQVSQLLDRSIVESWETYDLYALMYRGRLYPQSPAEMKILAGFTNQSDGYISIQSDIALPCNWSLQPSFSYVAADDRRGGGGHIEEAWNLGISLVWRPWARGCGSCADYDRPLFNVADNGSMIVHQPVGRGGVGVAGGEGEGGGGDIGL